MKSASQWLVILAAVTTGAVSCLTRPVGTELPTTKESFTTSLSQAQVDKVDLLFMIDNSASMGDKQAVLADAVPQLIQGLLKPKCVDANGVPTGGVAEPLGTKDNHYGCASGDPEFKPLTDMHLAIVSSSLGSYGGDVCTDTGRSNDRGHLLDLVKGGSELQEAKPSNFLSWFPSSEDNADAKRHPAPTSFGGTAITDVDALNKDFQTLVVGVDQTGCGFESQLESWYHFLVAPDPWVKITVDGNGQADYGTDVDVDLLRQRADFLRPDSLVAIISLSDEDDSGTDPLSVGGQGWAFHASKFPGSPAARANNGGSTAPRGTSICQTNPLSPDCTSCGFAASCNASDPSCQKMKNDPNCQANGGYFGSDQDQLNSRWSWQLVRPSYGVDPQYPLKRYVDGLTKQTVPSRAQEHATTCADGSAAKNGSCGGARRIISGYGPAASSCTNPLFARNLPRGPGDDFCGLATGSRSPDLVFFAHIGGVPNQLLYKKKDGSLADGSTAASELDPQQRISPINWTPILGADPFNYDFSGIDIHMVESKTPRQGIPGPSTTHGDNGTDPVVGRDWDTKLDDLQFACTFDLPQPKTCANGDPSCQCDGTLNPPLCGTTANTQVKAKAYPTIREFMVVKALGENGIIASLCPLTLQGDKNAPAYGYNPAVAAIVDRLKNALTTQCLPHPLTREPGSNDVSCLVLAQLADAGDKCANYQLQEPAPEVLAKFREQQKKASGNVGDGGIDLSALPVCEVPQKVVATGDTCKDDTAIDWCYVENDPATGKGPAGRCPQALLFSTGSGQLGGARFSLQCIQQQVFGRDGG
ncbi:hypothetical protein AKJ09_00348 [Labilithrix luteola]|uniref:Uncharacterized protein n=1 Tax=Labilithrix luteola TaxID=1391654 RepID=A0A0K1PKP7_9BACT|nr:hypothetical protein [Labilithrix luteola]AKU93684.1 hypothetical protein AKJ09_00348 [Labilithrix luteola]